jgi:hypothetical protein
VSYDRSIATFFSCQKQGYYGAWGGHCATQGSKSARFLLGSGRSYVSLDVRAFSRLVVNFRRVASFPNIPGTTELLKVQSSEMAYLAMGY